MNLPSTSYHDLIRDKDWRARQEVARSLYDSDHPEAGALLRQALQDPEERVRLYAAQALELISKRYQQQLDQLRQKLQKGPKDFALRQSLAELLIRYAANFVESSEIQAYYYNEAKEQLQTALAHQPEHPGLLLSLGKLLHLMKQSAEAKAVLDKIGHSRAEYPAARFLLAEMALEEGAMDRVREECQRIKERSLSQEQRAVVDFWCASDE